MRKILYILLPVFILAQVNYVLKKDVLSAGGRKMTNTSANYVLQGTISQTTIGKVEDTNYKGVIGFWHPPEAIPPSSPYIAEVKKASNDSDVVFTWNKITTDTLGNSELMHYYVVYRNTSPSFIPASSDSIGYASHPDTTYTDTGALDSTDSYYYLVKAVDWARNQSKKSNMGYKLNKFVNENTGATGDRNWVSLPWYSEYDSIYHLTSDLSPTGDPISKITNLKDDQIFENWIHHPSLGWYGDTFDIESGRAYEMIAVTDATILLVGSNNPAGEVPLNENAGAIGDRNWVSIPYNAAYDKVIDITNEYSSAGEVIVKITNLKDSQVFENWIHHPSLGWYGDTFDIIAGRGYEFVAVTDSTWNPTEYTNESGMMLLAARRNKKSDLDIHLGKSIVSDRSPAWSIKEDIDRKPIILKSKPELNKKIDYQNADVCESVIEKSKLESKKKTDYLDVDIYEPVSKKLSKIKDYREAGISHVVRAEFDAAEYTDIVFTAYRLNKPYDVLTENVLGGGIAQKDGFGVFWFDVGNFMRPWQHGEEVILIIEASKQGRGYFTVVNFKLDNGVDIQELCMISLEPIPKPDVKTTLSSVRWKEVKNVNVVGYSLYKDDERINEKVITEKEYSVQGEIILRPVIQGGYETVYGSCHGSQSLSNDNVPILYSFNIYPNPFAKKTGINYALPQAVKIEIKVYDVSGRQVKILVSEKLEPGYYKTLWYGKDNIGRKVSAGIYFIRMNTKGFESQQKVIFVR
ncbi:T9SS type A sorting domain-containing protein [candidate division WOR-3 bacterium]|nr:T9SS type A sorting domain-containing protein [candidate division WOR-3 bacterium]